MDLATISLSALLVVVLLSCVTNANVGLLAISLAWIIGAYLAPAHDAAISVKTVAACFPVDLFINLAGVTLLFSIAQHNGTLRLITRAGVRACQGFTHLVPWLFFLLACGLSAAGAGNVPTVALLASSAMLTAQRLGISPLVMTIMIGHGSIGGTMSPLSPMGLIARDNMAAMGLVGYEGYTFGMNLAVNTIVAAVGYVLFRGWRMSPVEAGETTTGGDEDGRAAASNLLTLGLLAALIVGAVFFELHIGLAAFCASTVLILSRTVDERAAIRDMPWNVLLMVCGMSVLVTLCEKTGGLELFSELLARFATPHTVTAWMAGVTGLISVFSSTSGVVLPAFLPTVRDVAAHLGIDNLLAIATSVNIGSNLVDVSSVSTIGALCVAATPGEAARRLLFRQALIWGLSMSVVGALVCWAIL